MLILVSLLQGVADDGGIRMVLLMLVIVAGILLVAGGAIAILTFVNVRKTQKS